MSLLKRIESARPGGRPGGAGAPGAPGSDLPAPRRRPAAARRRRRG